MEQARTALIIGGGIAGQVAALALRKAGIEATVYEAYRVTADGVGGMLGLAPNGVNALGVVGAGGVIDEIGEPASSMVMQSWTGKRLAEFGHVPGPPILHLVWRSDLYQALYERAVAQGIRVEHGKRLVGIEESPGGVGARFADGSRASADILIGADGIRSVVRTLVDPDAPAPTYTGLLGFGGWSSAVDPDAVPGAMYMSFGKRAFFGHATSADGRTGWFANLPRPATMSVAEATAVGAEEWLRVLRAEFAGDRFPAVDIVRGTAPADLVTVGGMEILPPVPRWHRDRIVLIGDAAHVPSPSSGQGASQAIEGAVQLARCLRDLPIADAFQAYDRIRRPRIERITAMAARTNKSKAAGPIARVLRDLLLPVTMKLLAKPEKMAWQNEYRIDWNAAIDSSAPVLDRGVAQHRT